MARYAGRNWTRAELAAWVGDPMQIAGARGCVLTDGKADGVRAVEVNTGAGLTFTVLPGRGMDIALAMFKGRALSFFSGTGITSPSYYEEPGFGFLRSFYAGLLTTCGITQSGAPTTDEGKPYGLHGRIANSAAENLSIDQDWEGEEYVIRLKGTMRETAAMGENLALTRRIEARLGVPALRIHDTIANRGFSPQPIPLLYHFNFGFPLLAAGARVVAPIVKTVPRDEEARKDRGVEECLVFPEPIPDYQEKVFFHTLAGDAAGRTFVALLNRDAGEGQPLGIVIRWSLKELPLLCHWKMPHKGFYVQGLEPCMAPPMGRGALRPKGELPMLEGQATHDVTIDVEVVDTEKQLDAIEAEAKKTAKK
ncbi:MAG TPA: aldose 1-epimerase family protein [Spirochaetia bacterium]